MSVASFDYGLLRPADDGQWEVWCKVIFAKVLGLTDIQRFRGAGYEQFGIDLLVTLDDGAHVGIQCKKRNTDADLKQKDAERDLRKSKKLEVRLSRFIFATTHTANNLQQWAAKKTKASKRSGGPRVEVYAWPQIQDLLNEHPDVRQKLIGAPARPTDNLKEAGIVRPGRLFGREDDLRRLHEAVRAGNTAIVHALVGEGGVGKTELAKEYVFRHQADHDGVWWVDASEAVVDAQTAGLYKTLTGREAPQGTTPEQVRVEVLRILEQKKADGAAGRHLVILDNVEEIGRLGEWQMQGGSRVLATTRKSVEGTAAFRAFNVDVLSEEAAIDLLAAACAGRTRVPTRDELRAITVELGNHTLATALAASYLQRHADVSAAEYVKLIRQTGVGEAEPREEGEAHDPLALKYRHSVRASLGLHFGEFRDAPAMKLLELAAFCHPTGIPIEVLAAAGEMEVQEARRWVRKLADVSVVKYDETIGVHRLTQSTVRTGLDAQQRHDCLGAVVRTLADRLPGPENYARWSEFAALEPHAAAAVRHVGADVSIEEAGLLANEVGVYYHRRMWLSWALAMLREAERIDRAAYGDNHARVAIRVNNVAGVLQDRGDLGGALRALREAERIDRAEYGNDHPAVARDMNNIGCVLCAQGDLRGALKAHREAERIDRAAYGDDHPDVATDVNNVGSVLRARGYLDRALKAFREAERIDRAAHGDNHPVLARDANSIGGVLQVQGNLGGALKEYREAERIDRAAFGDDHAAVARDLGNTGTVLKAQGDLDGAMKAYREGERIDRAVYGDSHPAVARDVNNIGRVLQDRGDLGGALKAFREAERIDRAALGNDHANVAVVVNNIGSVLQDQGDVGGARAKYEEAFRIFLVAHGPRGENVAGVAGNLLSVGGDPIAVAREIGGDEVAEQLRAAVVEEYGADVLKRGRAGGGGEGA